MIGGEVLALCCRLLGLNIDIKIVGRLGIGVYRRGSYWGEKHYSIYKRIVQWTRLFSCVTRVIMKLDFSTRLLSSSC